MPALRVGCLALAAVILVTPPVRAQSAEIQLAVRADSWLPVDGLAFELEKELREQLQTAHLEVSARSDLPLVIFDYEETQDVIRYAERASATRIAFRITVNDRTTGGGSLNRRFISRPQGQELQNPPTDRELRDRTVALLKADPVFRLAGHFVGAQLGLESSLRVLVSGSAGRFGLSYAVPIVLERLPWSPGNDELFERSVVQVGAYWKDGTWLEEYLQKQRPFMQGVNPPALGSAVAAITILGSIGGPSAARVLGSISSGDVDPRIVEAATSAVERINSRRGIR